MPKVKIKGMKRRKPIEGIYVDGSLELGNGAFMISENENGPVMLIGPKLEIKKCLILGGSEPTGFITKKMISQIESLVRYCKKDHERDVKLKKAMRRK